MGRTGPRGGGELCLVDGIPTFAALSGRHSCRSEVVACLLLCGEIFLDACRDSFCALRHADLRTPTLATAPPGAGREGRDRLAHWICAAEGTGRAATSSSTRRLGRPDQPGGTGEVGRRRSSVIPAAASSLLLRARSGPGGEALTRHYHRIPSLSISRVEGAGQAQGSAPTCPAANLISPPPLRPYFLGENGPRQGSVRGRGRLCLPCPPRGPRLGHPSGSLLRYCHSQLVQK